MSNHRNAALFVILGALWGGAYPAIKVRLDAIPPVLYVAVRYDIASLIMLGYIVVAVDYWYPRSRADWINATIGGVLIIGAYNAFLFLVETIVPSAVAGILVGLMPIFTTLFSRLFLPSEEFDLAGLVGVALGFFGVLIISRPDPSNLLTAEVVGQLFVLVAAASMALGSVLTERYEATQPAITMETWSMLLGAIFLHIAVFAQPDVAIDSARWTDTVLAMVLYLSVFSSAVAYFIYFYLLEQLGPFEMNFIAYAAAAFSALFGWVLLSEGITIATIVGYVVILGGFVLLKRDRIRSELGSSPTPQTSD
jgi:drug/metabolite transporter (DMT)-like permease